jgi:hypothetical protein
MGSDRRESMASRKIVHCRPQYRMFRVRDIINISHIVALFTVRAKRIQEEICEGEDCLMSFEKRRDEHLKMKIR